MKGNYRKMIELHAKLIAARDRRNAANRAIRRCWNDLERIAIKERKK